MGHPQRKQLPRLGLPISNLILFLKSMCSSNRLSGLDVVVLTAVAGATHLASLPVWQEKQGRWPHLTHRKWEGEASPCGYAGDTMACVVVRTRAAHAVQRQTMHSTGRYHHTFYPCCLFHRRRQSWSDPQASCPEKLLRCSPQPEER